MHSKGVGFVMPQTSRWSFRFFSSETHFWMLPQLVTWSDIYLGPGLDLNLELYSLLDFYTVNVLI